MGKSALKWSLIVASAILGLFLLINWIAGIAAPDKYGRDAGHAKCREQGWKDPDLALSESTASQGLLGSTATVAFWAKNQNKSIKIHMTLRKTINLQEWEVVDYREEPNK